MPRRKWVVTLKNKTIEPGARAYNMTEEKLTPREMSDWLQALVDLRMVEVESVRAEDVEE